MWKKTWWWSWTIIGIEFNFKKKISVEFQCLQDTFKLKYILLYIHLALSELGSESHSHNVIINVHRVLSIYTFFFKMSHWQSVISVKHRNYNNKYGLFSSAWILAEHFLWCLEFNLCLTDEYLSTNMPRRTTADQEVLALIAPLAKLGRFEVATDFFPSLCTYN